MPDRTRASDSVRVRPGSRRIRDPRSCWSGLDPTERPAPSPRNRGLPRRLMTTFPPPAPSPAARWPRVSPGPSLPWPRPPRHRPSPSPAPRAPHQSKTVERTMTDPFGRTTTWVIYTFNFVGQSTNTSVPNVTTSGPGRRPGPAPSSNSTWQGTTAPPACCTGTSGAVTQGRSPPPMAGPSPMTRCLPSGTPCTDTQGSAGTGHPLHSEGAAVVVLRSTGRPARPPGETLPVTCPPRASGGYGIGERPGPCWTPRPGQSTRRRPTPPPQRKR